MYKNGFTILTHVTNTA